MKLKALSLPDLERVRQWRNSQIEMLRTPFLLTEEMQVQFYKDVICNRQANARYWGVWHEQKFPIKNVCTNITIQKCGTEPILIGMAGLENIQWENRLAEISLLFNPQYPMDKYGEEALQLLLHEGFMNMNLENIYTEVYACNPNLPFWARIIDKYGCLMSYLPDRKYLNGQYFSSSYINISKGAFLKHENPLSQSTQALN